MFTEWMSQWIKERRELHQWYEDLNSNHASLRESGFLSGPLFLKPVSFETSFEIPSSAWNYDQKNVCSAEKEVIKGKSKFQMLKVRQVNKDQATNSNYNIQHSLCKRLNITLLVISNCTAILGIPSAPFLKWQNGSLAAHPSGGADFGNKVFGLHCSMDSNT